MKKCLETTVFAFEYQTNVKLSLSCVASEESWSMSTPRIYHISPSSSGWWSWMDNKSPTSLLSKTPWLEETIQILSHPISAISRQQSSAKQGWLVITATSTCLPPPIQPISLQFVEILNFRGLSKNIARIANAVQVTLWLSVTNPQCHDFSFCEE